MGRSRVESRLIVVVFPAPLGPSRPKNSPVSMRRSRESTAVKLSNFFVRFFVSIISVHFLSFVCKFHSIILEKKRHFNNSEMFFTEKGHCAIVIRRKNRKRRENHETQDENNNAASSDYAAAMPDTGSGCRWRERSEDRSGEYSIQVELEGGSGKASVSSPTLMLVKDGKMYARLQWSSSNYDYMIVDGEKYLNESEEGRNSVFTVPVTALDDKMEVIADTLAMGAPHEIDYTLTFYEASIGSKGQLPQEAAKRVVAVALVIIIGGGILNYFVNKRNRC